MRPLLVLRPEPGATATTARAVALGLSPIKAPLFAIAPCPWQAPDPASYDALLLTSANAVRHAGDALGRYRRLPAWAVGEATARAAKEAGLCIAQVGEEDAAALLARMAAAGVRSVLHLAGREHRPGEAHGLTVDRRIVYRADAVGALPAAAVAAIDRGCVALLHSARAAATFVHLVANMRRGRCSLVAIAAPARARAGPGWREVQVAPQPTDAAMLAIAARLCEEAA